MYNAVSYGVLLDEDKIPLPRLDRLKNGVKSGRKERDNDGEKGSDKKSGTCGDMNRYVLYIHINDLISILTTLTKLPASRSNNRNFYLT